jgi:hypothetical protein
MLTFLKKYAGLTVFGCFLLLLSYISFHFAVFHVTMFVLICAATAITAFKNLKYGWYIALFELLIGSQGYFFFVALGGQKISMRLAIFIIMMLAWAYHMWCERSIAFLQQKLSRNYLMFAAILLLGAVHGVLAGYAPKDVFLDVNGFFYFAYIGVIAQIYTQGTSEADRRELLLLTTSAISIVALHSFFLLYIYAHALEGAMRVLYTWTRDHRFGEIARPFIDSDFHRVFFQHQIFQVFTYVTTIYTLFVADSQLAITYKRWVYALTIISFTVVLLSFSRSFWVGLALTGITMAGVLLYYYARNLQQFAHYLKVFVISSCATLVVLGTVMLIPHPSFGAPSIGSDVFFKRIEVSTNEPAAGSRWNLLPVIFKANLEAQIWGHGFGKRLIYQAKDPRVLTPENPEGWYSTFAFEWGYLDIWLKIGFIGLILYALILKQLYATLWRLRQQFALATIERSIIDGYLLSSVALLVIHFFTPYLNHPLGIGFILFGEILVYLFTENKKKAA